MTPDAQSSLIDKLRQQLATCQEQRDAAIKAAELALTETLRAQEAERAALAEVRRLEAEVRVARAVVRDLEGSRGN